jgi:hypothetical protein
MWHIVVIISECASLVRLQCARPECQPDASTTASIRAKCDIKKKSSSRIIVDAEYPRQIVVMEGGAVLRSHEARCGNYILSSFSPLKFLPLLSSMIILWILLSSFLHHSIGATFPTKPSYDTHNYYVLAHNSQLGTSGASLADVTAALGVELVEQVGELKDHWLVRQSKPGGDIVARDGTDQVIKALEMLKAQAQAPHTARSEEAYLARRVVSSVDYLSLQFLRLRVKRAPPSITKNVSASRAMAERFGFRDPKFPEQWHIVNDDYPEHMMNVSGVWEMGFKGKGVISSLVDDGLDYESEDLSANFVRAPFSCFLS